MDRPQPLFLCENIVFGNGMMQRCFIEKPFAFNCIMNVN